MAACGFLSNSEGCALNELALFAGAGGGILGGKLLGWRTVCAVEWQPYALGFCASDKTMEFFSRSRSGMTFAPSTGSLDEEWLTWFLEASVPDISSAGKGAGITGERSGLDGKWLGLLMKYDPASSSWRTPNAHSSRTRNRAW